MLGRNPERAAEARAEDFGALADAVRTLPCCVWQCTRTSSDPAHVVSRGAGGHAWMMGPSGETMVGNIAPICRAHHTGGDGVRRPQHQIGTRAFETENTLVLRLPGHAGRRFDTLAEVAQAVGEWFLTDPDLGAPA